jgi:hypothetical protein
MVSNALNTSKLIPPRPKVCKKILNPPGSTSSSQSGSGGQQIKVPSVIGNFVITEPTPAQLNALHPHRKD